MSKSKQQKTLTATDVELVQDEAQRSPRRRSTSASRLSLKFTQDSKTQQQFKNTVDPNVIIRNYAQTGVDPYAHRAGSQKYGVPPSKNYTEAMYLAAEVQSQFHDLPARERAQFNNSPADWLRALEAQSAQTSAPEALTPQNPSDPVPPDPDIGGDLDIT